MSKELVLVSASSGLDSTCTLLTLQAANYKNIIAVHYNYGHRGQGSELFAITNICKELNIPLKVFNLESIYKELDVESISMLSNKNAEIITGTEKGLKSTAAWTPGRNMMFMTIMMTLAESEIMKHNYEKVYFSGGFLQLTESATYPDNTPYFTSACLGLGKYGTLVGNRFEILYGLANLMKFEQYALIKEFKWENILKHCISCDRPVLQLSNDGKPLMATNCMKNGIPACGSGLLSYWASKKIGMDDMKLRNFYVVDDPNYEAYIPAHMKQNIIQKYNIDNIIDRILLPKDKLENLKKELVIKKSTC